MADSNLAFIGREFNPLWDANKRKIIKFNLLAKDPLTINFHKAWHTYIVASSGGGKSYLARVYTEELIRTMQNYAVVILDPMGVFTTLNHPNTNQDELRAWNDQMPGEVVGEAISNYEVWVPAGDRDQFQEGSYDGLFSLPACEITPGTLCYTFDMDPLEPQVNLYRKAQKRLKKEQGSYELADLTAWIREHGRDDLHFKDPTIEALIAKLEALEELGLISREGICVPEMIREGKVITINLSASEYHTSRVVVNFLAEKLLELRKKGKALVDFARTNKVKVDCPPWYVPPTQIVIDEAHNFLPKSAVLQKCIKQGRGCELVITAISQAVDLPRDIYTNLTHLFAGALTYSDDIEDVFRMLPVDWTLKDFRKEVKALGPGCFLYFNREEKHSKRIRVRPSRTLHLASTDIIDERRYFNGMPIPVPSPVLPDFDAGDVPPPVPAQEETLEPAAGTGDASSPLDPILFSEDYPKLHEPKFTTIRRTDKGYQEQQFRPIVLKEKGMMGTARITFKHKKTLPELDTQFLLKDTCRNTREAAINLLNSFYETPIAASEKLTILGLEWVK